MRRNLMEGVGSPSCMVQRCNNFRLRGPPAFFLTVDYTRLGPLASLGSPRPLMFTNPNLCKVIKRSAHAPRPFAVGDIVENLADIFSS